MKKIVPILFTLLIILSIGCSQQKNISLVNTAHLDHLYENVIVNNDTLGIIHIYSEYPDYKWVSDDDEGKACVDDAARAMVFYLYLYDQTGNNESLIKVKKILNFLFYMQAENGFFYNFIWDDNKINKTYKTSVAEPGWWSWRAMWALAEAAKHFKVADKTLYEKINSHLKRLLEVSEPWLIKDKKYSNYSGFSLPAWLPYESASDQAAVILKGLNIYYETEKDSSILPVIKTLAEGISGMQVGDVNAFPHYAFLSWQNTWHSWGNSQADALLASGKILNDTLLINKALKEIKYFYTYLMNEKYMMDFSISKGEDNKAKVITKNKYAQIAYGFRPMIFASLSAYEITGDKFYAELAGKISRWFLGENLNSAKMYNPETGVCFDGIVNEERINQNSGAESTIESLLSFVKIEKNPIAKKIAYDYYNSRAKEK